MNAPGLASLIVVFALVACRDETTEPIAPPADEIPPAAVLDLAIDGITETTIRLSWSAPGNDGLQGVAWRYDVRYSTEPITPDTWNAAEQVGGEPPPGFAGWVQLFEIIDLEPAQTYYFALESYDHDQNRSELSNVVSATTGGAFDAVDPGTIEDLRAIDVAATSVTLTWTAPGDDGHVGTVQGYIVRYATFVLDESNFGTGNYVRWTPIPHPPGQSEQLVVDGLSPASTYHLAARAVDDGSNVSSLSNVVMVTTQGDGVKKGVEW